MVARANCGGRTVVDAALHRWDVAALQLAAAVQLDVAAAAVLTTMGVEHCSCATLAAAAVEASHYSDAVGFVADEGHCSHAEATVGVGLLHGVVVVVALLLKNH